MKYVWEVLKMIVALFAVIGVDVLITVTPAKDCLWFLPIVAVMIMWVFEQAFKAKGLTKQ